MSATVHITISGIAEIRAKLTPEAFRAALVGAMGDALTPVAVAASALAPHKTGILAASIRARSGTRGNVFSAAVVSGVGYGHLVEYGHRTIPRGPAQGAVIGFKVVTRYRRRGGFVSSKQVTVPIREGRRAALNRRRSLGATGFVPAHPFARPAFAAKQGNVTQIIERRLAQAIAGHE